MKMVNAPRFNGFLKDKIEWRSMEPPVPNIDGKSKHISLGIVGCEYTHDSAAALVINGEIICAVEEERFHHIKHIGAYPFHSIDYCLQRAGISLNDVDRISYGYIPDRYLQTIVHEPCESEFVEPRAITARTNQVKAMAGIVSAIEQRYKTPIQSKFHWVNHHYAHAASAFYPSQFDRALILCVDGGGDRETASLFSGSGNSLELVHSFLDYPESLGRFYDLVTRFVIENPTLINSANTPSSGQTRYALDPGKLMGLAGYGKVDPHYFDGLLDIDESDCDHPVRFDMSYFSVHSGEYPFSAKWKQRFGKPRSRSSNWETHHYTMAASAQWILERAMVALAKCAKKKFPEHNKLCLSGGTALNVCANRRILDEAGFSDIFIAPAANDAGTALGAALAVQASAGQLVKSTYSVYSGPDISLDFDIERELKSFGARISFEKLEFPELCEVVASRLAQNQIIGWAQNRMEFGPRGLGNRSILANPANPLAKDIVNAKVKKREHFRPYAASILQEHAREWLDIDHSPYMLIEATVHPHKRSNVASIVHIDNTTRPQTVSYEDNHEYYTLLTSFHKITGIPLLLNTSLNGHGDTIVNTPVDAALFLLNSEIDAIVIGNYLVTRR